MGMGMGEVLALGSAFIWSFSIILFKVAEENVDPLLLNLMKNLMAFLLLIPTIWLLGGDHWSSNIAAMDWILMMASGLIGIGIADALVLKCLHHVGPTRLAIIECLYSPCIIALSVLFLSESLTFFQFFGASLVVLAVLLVSYKSEDSGIDPPILLRGTIYGALGILLMGVGIILVKPVLARVPLLQAVEIRLFAGVISSIAFWLSARRPLQTLLDFQNSKRKGLILGACFLSTYIAMIMWVAGFKFSEASIAAVLNQTSTIFTVSLSVLLLRERLTRTKLTGTLLAICGVLMMTLIGHS